MRLKGLSLFSNVGVAEAYFKEIGIDILIANEIDEQRAKFYQEVYKDTHVICGDITDDKTRTEIINEARQEEIEFVIATPPCQGMSEAGLRLEFDSRNQLIYYAVDIIKRLNPKFVLMENVPQQLKTKIKYNDEIILIPEYVKRELGENYNFNKNTLVMAKDYDVPQLRERNIFLLVRKDLPYVWEFPKKQKEITLREAIGNLPSLDPLLREGLEETLKHLKEMMKKILYVG